MKKMRFHNYMRDPLRVAAKAGFISKRIWNEFYGAGNRQWKFRRWQGLLKSSYFKQVPDYGFIDSAITLTDLGRALADELGYDPVFSPPAKNLWHDEELIRLALFLERQGWISSWRTEQELKMNKKSQQYFRDQVRAVKIPDLIIEWNTTPKKIIWAVELERTRKEATRYYDMVGAYQGISRIESVLIIVAAHAIEYEIKKAQGKLNYPQTQRPMFFASMSEVISSPISCELRQGANRLELGKFATAFTGINDIKTPADAIGAGNKLGNSVSSQ